MQRGEVWWVEFDPSIGSEIRKTRPAVIVRNDAANRNLSRVVVVPLTSSTGRQYPGEAVVTVGGQSSKAMADQIMADRTRIGTGVPRDRPQDGRGIAAMPPAAPSDLVIARPIGPWRSRRRTGLLRAAPSQ